MKRFFLMAAALLLSVCVFAQGGVKWESGSLQEALDKAASNKKSPSVVFLDCYTSWCGPCKMMANNVFPTKEAGDYFNARFVNIKIDMEKGEGPSIAKKYGIRAYPTFLILDSQGNEIGRVVGGGQLPQFIEKVEAAIDPAKQPEMLLEKYNKSGDIKDAYTYMEALEKEYREDKIAGFITANYDKLTARGGKHSAKLWGYLVKAISLSDTQVLEKIVADKLDYESFLGKEKVNKDLSGAINNCLFGYLVGKSDLSQANVLRGCELYMFMADNMNNMESLILELAKAKAAGDYGKMVEKLDGRFIGYALHSGQMRSIQRILFNTPEIPDVEKARFVKEYKEFLQRNIEEIEKAGEQYKDIEVPQRKMTGAMPMIRMN